MKRMYHTTPPVLLADTASPQEVHAGFHNYQKDSPFGSLATTPLHFSCYLLAILSVVILFIFCSCQREESPEDIPLAVAKKKLVLQSAVQLEREDSLFLFSYCTDKESRLDSYSKLPFSHFPDLILTQGEKILVALCGFKEEDIYFEDISTLEGMRTFCSSLEDENPKKPRLSGITQVEAGTNKTLQLCLEPLLSKIHIRSIKADFTGKPYENMELDSICCYLSYANALCPVLAQENISADVLCNYGYLNKEDLTAFIHPEMLYQEIPGQIGKEGKQVDVELYCYPNQNPTETFATPFTRLVIECSIGGERFYYPIPLGRESPTTAGAEIGIARNKCYALDICLKHLGSRDPDQIIESKDLSLTFSVCPWDNRNEKSEKF